MSKLPPPSEFSLLGLHGEYISCRNGREWHGPCPFCQGEDRFRIHTDHPFPKWNWECRKCGKKGWADQLNESVRETLSPERLEAIREAEEARRQARLAEIEQTLDTFTTQEIWEYLHKRMSDENYAWWRKQGIPKAWVDFWRFGYISEKKFMADNGLFVRAAYTMPKFDLGWKPMNMDYRIVDPPPGVGKYRPEYNLPAACFLSRPDKEQLDDEVFVVEGTKKAAVVAIHHDTHADTPTVFGVPSCNSWAGVEERVKDCGRVWVIFDPDATLWAEKFAKVIGKAARLVELPVKPDDAFIKYGMTSTTWKETLKYARRL